MAGNFADFHRVKTVERNFPVLRALTAIAQPGGSRRRDCKASKAKSAASRSPSSSRFLEARRAGRGRIAGAVYRLSVRSLRVPSSRCVSSLGDNDFAANRPTLKQVILCFYVYRSALRSWFSGRSNYRRRSRFISPRPVPAASGARKEIDRCWLKKSVASPE
jgi:hypothetical protein